MKALTPPPHFKHIQLSNNLTRRLLSKIRPGCARTRPLVPGEIKNIKEKGAGSSPFSGKRARSFNVRLKTYLREVGSEDRSPPIKNLFGAACPCPTAVMLAQGLRPRPRKCFSAYCDKTIWLRLSQSLQHARRAIRRSVPLRGRLRPVRSVVCCEIASSWNSCLPLSRPAKPCAGNDRL